MTTPLYYGIMRLQKHTDIFTYYEGGFYVKEFISKVKDWCKKNGKKILVIGGIIIIAGVGIFLYRRDKEKLLDLIEKFKKAVDKVLSWRRRKKKNKHSKAAYAKRSPRANSTNQVKPQVPQSTPLVVPESVLTKEDEKSAAMSLVKEETVVSNLNIPLEPSPSDEDTISVSEDSENEDSEIPQKTKKHRKKQHVFLVTLKGYEEKQKIIPFDADQFTLKLIKDLDGKKPIGSTATVVYIDDFDQIFVDWTDGGQAKLTEEQLLSNFVAA